MGGTDDPSNLRALCSSCNEGASNTTLMRPDLKKLLLEVRRTTTGGQLEILKWLSLFQNSVSFGTVSVSEAPYSLISEKQVCWYYELYKPRKLGGDCLSGRGSFCEADC
jgi:hypothetical protein